MAILNNTTISGSLTVTGNIKENGTLLVNKYLGLTAKAADSDKLDGHNSDYFYPAANPNGYTAVTESTVSDWGFSKTTGTVTSVDSVSPSSGDVALSAVRYVSQTLTDAQKTQARTNIGAGTSDFTGYTSSNKLSTDYIDNVAGWTSNTGTITGVSVNGTSVATSGVANITSVPWSIISSKPTIPATNVIPAITTANKVLLSTTTSGTAVWSSWSTAGLLKTNTSGVVSVDTTSYLSTTLSTSNNTRYLVGSSSTTSASLNTNSSCYMLSGELYSNGKNVAHWHNYLNYNSFPAAPASLGGSSVLRAYAALGCSTTNKFVILYGYIPTTQKTSTVTFFTTNAGGSTSKAFTNRPFVITSNYSAADAQSQRTIPTNITTTGFTCGNNTGQAVAWIALGFTTETLTN